MKIQSSCASISEEELAKLSVNLLNCQSAVEGRQQFPCTEKMVRLISTCILFLLYTVYYEMYH